MDPWRNLIEKFVDGTIDAPVFELEYIRLHSAEVMRGVSVRYAVDQLFYEVDAYCGDLKLRGPEDIGEEELLLAAKKALENWDRPWPPVP